jgi:hypothetical protein
VYQRTTTRKSQETIQSPSLDKSALHRLGGLPDRYGPLFVRNRYLKDDSYSLLRCNILDDPIRLTTFGASIFVQQHFPLEHSRPSLLSPRSIQEMCLSNALKCRQCCYISLRQGFSEPIMEPILRLRYGGLSDRSKRPQSRTRLFDFTRVGNSAIWHISSHCHGWRAPANGCRVSAPFIYVVTGTTVH